MLRTIAATVAHLIAAAALIAGLGTITTTGQAAATTPATAIATIVVTGTGTGGNTGTNLLVPTGTTGSGGNITPAAA